MKKILFEKCGPFRLYISKVKGTQEWKLLLQNLNLKHNYNNNTKFKIGLKFSFLCTFKIRIRAWIYYYDMVRIRICSKKFLGSGKQSSSPFLSDFCESMLKKFNWDSAFCPPVVLGVGRVATASAGAQRVEADGGEAADRLPVAQRRLRVTVHLSQLDVRHFLQQPAYGVFFLQRFLCIFNHRWAPAD